ncbi:1-deoxy-D-xylulose-5-phosphate synthase [bacterium]|nr:1-deoxy-D-xylulose-5-phosphate synthase [bacterium]
MLDNIKSPSDIKGFSIEKLETLCKEIRREIIDVSIQNGGHLGASLGAVELIIALHKVFDAPNDKIIFDVGHQAYAHKLITGRYAQFKTLRTYKGLSGFTNRYESRFDHFTAGHAGPSISIALGIQEALKQKKKDNHVIAVIGDGSFSSGISFEGLNNAGMMKNRLMIVLNDNKMSISENVGAISKWLSRAITGSGYKWLKESIKSFLSSKGRAGEPFLEIGHKLSERFRILFTPGILFEGMGFEYVGPVDGHNLEELIETFNTNKNNNRPVLIHIMTKKGKGYLPSEENPEKYHGISPKKNSTTTHVTWTDIFSQTLVKMAKDYKDIIAITAAMPNGTGLDKFYKYYPDRFYDVGIAEQHAVAFAAGMANEGLKPYVAIYSTFLQRSIDQIFHEVSLQNLNVTFIIDRAGFVGEDGATHHGVFDIPLLRVFPNMVIASPKDALELQQMVYTSYHYKKGPFAIRFPRGKAPNVPENIAFKEIPIGNWDILFESKKIELGNDNRKIILLLNGWIASFGKEIGEKLEFEGINSTIINSRFIKPLDGVLLNRLINKDVKIITVEESALAGGFGSAVLEWLSINKKIVSLYPIALQDEYVEHGTQSELRKKVGLEINSIIQKIKSILS